MTALAISTARGSAADSFIDEQVSKATSGIYRAQDALAEGLQSLTNRESPQHTYDPSD